MKKFLPGCLFFFSVNFCSAQSVKLDPTFGTKGIVKTDMGTSFNYNSTARQVLVQPGGGMYIIMNGDFPGSVISKWLASGSIDSSYGTNGYSGSVSVTEAFAALQQDGKIVIAGSAGNNSFITERLLANGSPDSTFGTNGIKATEFSGPSFARSVAIQGDGKIVVAGHTADNTNTYFAVVRYTATGINDNTFNGNGQALTDFKFKWLPDFSTDSLEVHEAYAYSVSIQADGKIVAGGYANTGTNYDFAVARYNTNGTPDNTFSNDSKQTIDFLGANDNAYSLAIQTNGKIVLGGYTLVGPDNHFALARFNTDGSIDNSFNGNGKQTADVVSDVQIGNSLAIQATSKIVMAGYTLNGDYHDFAIARFNADGTTDNGFGTNGILTTDFISSDDYAGSIAIQADDKIVVAGYSYIYSDNIFQEIAVSRYNADGSLDNSFANGGKLEGSSKQGFTSYNATAIQTNGKVVAVGKTWNGSNYDFAIARYNVNGSLDNTFSADGKQTTDFGGADEALSVAIQNDGKIIVAGNNDSQFAIARYNTDGSLDNTFSGDGKQTVMMGFADAFKSAALQNDGKIVMAGYTYTDSNYDSAFFAVARFNTNGTLDNTFSADGKQYTDFNDAPSFASAVNIQTNGKIVVTGRSVINSQNNFAVARYNANGTLDNSFSQDGKVTSVFGADDYFAQSAALQSDGKLVVGGFSQISGDAATSFTAARYETNGDLDNTFGSNGYKITDLGAGFSLGASMAINSNGRIGVSGTNGNFAIGLFKTDGNLDSTFGVNGILITPVGLGSSSVQSIAFWNDKLYAVGSAQFPGTLGVVARYSLAEGGPLAVSLLDFKAIPQAQNKAVILQWQIASEKDLTGFSIERSANGVSFSPIAYIASTANSDSKANYSTVDKQPLNGVNFYRLKMFDKIGKFSYSKIISVNLTNELFSFKVFPNPVQNVLFVNANGENESASFQIIDETGRKISSVVVSLTANTAFSIYVNTLPKGVYNLQLQTKTKTEIRRFIKE